MGDGLKQVWGLNDPKGPPSTAQADQFKANYQSVLSAINTALQYTVVNAEKPKHGEKASERDELNSAYQAVIVKIDPSNPSAAQSLIEAALAKANSAKQAIAAFKADVEKDVANWQAQEPTFNKSLSMIEELEAWGHKLAETLRAIVKKIQEQVNNKLLKPALQALVELMQKLQPIYDDYLKQKAAKEKYDPAFAGLQPKLPTTCQYQKLAEKQQEIVTLQGQMEAQVKEKIYVEALALETQLETKVTEYQTQLEELEKQKKAYEESLAKLQPNLTNATVAPQHEKLADKRKEIDTGKAEMESAAQSEEFEQAHQKADDLSSKVDAYKTAVEELEKQKKAYEEALAKLQTNLTKATEAPQHEKLADKRKEIDTAKSEMEAAAKSEEYEKALPTATDLSTKVDAYVAAVEKLEKQKLDYETALAILKPKLPTSSDPEYPKLAPIEEEMVTIQGEMEKAAQAEEYEQALKLQGDLSAKLDEYTKTKEELEKQKEDYERGLADLQRRLADASVSKAQFADLQPIQQDMATIQTEMEAAAKAKDYENALRLLHDLDAKIKEYEDAVAKKKEEYEKALAAVQPKLEECLSLTRDFDSLKADRAVLEKGQQDLEAAAKAEDFDKGKQIATDLLPKADKYLEDTKKKQEEVDKKAEEITKKLDAASDVTRGDVARAVANGLKGSPDEIRHMPSAVRNRLLEEIQKGGISDNDKAACKVLFSEKYLDPQFEKIDRENQKKIIEKLKNDPEFKQARENWDKLDEKKRMEIMQKAVKVQAEVYGMAEPKMESYKTTDARENGYYDHDKGTLFIHDETLSKKGFDKYLETCMHENGHRQQATMIDNLSPPPDPPKIKKGDPTYEQAVTFKHNDTDTAKNGGFYVSPPGTTPSPDTGDEYFTQPQETHSRVVGAGIRKAGIGK